MIVALSGYARSGKDAAGEILVRQYGFVRRACADPLKAVARDLGWDGAKDDAGRVLLQNLGVSIRTHLHRDAWIWPVLLDLPPRLVITDVRYPNEAEAVKAAGGCVIRVERPSVGPVNAHLSEVALDEWSFDGTIVNDGSLADLEATVSSLVRWLERSDHATLRRL